MAPRIVLLCATDRGLQFLDRLVGLIPDAELTVCSFREEPWEPPFLDAIRNRTVVAGARFVETRDVAKVSALSGQDLLIAVSWRYLVPRAVYGSMRLGAYVLHDSMLPAYRGFSPTVWAIVNGEQSTGVTLFKMVDEMDQGPIVAQESVVIPQEAYVSDVIPLVTSAYLRVIERTIGSLLSGKAASVAQDETRASYCCKRLPQDNRIQWDTPAQAIVRLVRAVSRPYPGAYCSLNERKLTVWRASMGIEPPHYVGIVPGRLLFVEKGKGTWVLAADRPVLLEEVQLEDEEPRPAEEVLGGPGVTLS